MSEAFEEIQPVEQGEPPPRELLMDLIGYFARAYPWRSLVLLACVLLSGLFEGFSIALFLPLIQMVSSGNEVAGGRLGTWVAIAFERMGTQPSLGGILLFILAGMTLKGVFIWLGMRQVGFAVAHVATDFRLQMLDAVLHSRWSYFLKEPAGLFANAISSEALKAASAYQSAALAFSNIVQIVLYAMLSMLVSWQTTLLALIAGGVVMLALSGLIRISRRAGKQQVALLKSLTARMVDVLYGIKSIKAMAQEEHVLAMLKADTRALNRAKEVEVLASATLTAAQEPITVAFMAAGLYIVVSWSSPPLGSLLMLAFLFSRLSYQINTYVQNHQRLASYESAFWSIRQRIDKARANQENTIGGPPPPLDHALSADLSFAYGEKTILRRARFDIQSGQFVVLVGPSGAGKTTLIDLLLGLLPTDSGGVSIDGKPLTEIDRLGWRRKIGYVPQEFFLFHDTIYHNVTLGDAAITRTAAEEALRAADAWTFVDALPGKLEAMVGERGSTLSGGQRQRIAIARALVRKPVLLVLDEVTTSLDPRTEAEICATLTRLKGRTTIFAISHQPALLASADVVLRLESGIVKAEPRLDKERHAPHT